VSYKNISVLIVSHRKRKRDSKNSLLILFKIFGAGTLSFNLGLTLLRGGSKVTRVFHKIFVGVSQKSLLL